MTGISYASVRFGTPASGRGQARCVADALFDEIPHEKIGVASHRAAPVRVLAVSVAQTHLQ